MQGKVSKECILSPVPMACLKFEAEHTPRIRNFGRNMKMSRGEAACPRGKGQEL